MPEQEYASPGAYGTPRVKKKRGVWLPLLLFALSFATTTIAGVEWLRGFGRTIEFTELGQGLPYAVSILTFLAFHEFGHYFASRWHKVDTSLPFFIPFLSLQGFFLNFGTMGAVIRTREAIPSRKALFDIGIAGPLCGFVVCCVLLSYGFSTLPGKEFILSIHPDYFSPGYGKGALNLQFGSTLLYSVFQNLFASPGAFIPPMSEIYHYPFLCAGWFGMFVTAMNMIPVGQLDGGHISYAMFGNKNHYYLAAVSLIALIVLGVLGFLKSYLLPELPMGWSGWLFWAVVLYFFIKIKHPPVYVEEDIGTPRKVLGYVSFLIFALSFSPSPFILEFIN